jgi:hypothetical protein
MTFHHALGLLAAWSFAWCAPGFWGQICYERVGPVECCGVCTNLPQVTCSDGTICRAIAALQGTTYIVVPGNGWSSPTLFPPATACGCFYFLPVCTGNSSAPCAATGDPISTTCSNFSNPTVPKDCVHDPPG